MAYSIERMPERISIGRETETGVTDVMIDCGAWVSKWPGMALHAIHTPEGGAPYILQTETDGSVLVWHVTDADTATPGTGRMEIVGEMDGRRKVSATVKVSVAARMSGTVGEPPVAAKPWADRVVEAAGRVTGMQVQAETLDAGSGATAEWDGEQGLLTIGVPKGEQGPKGEKGENGPQGEKGEPGKDAVVDATLTQSGQAADAKVTGDVVSQLKDDLVNTYKYKDDHPQYHFEQGTIRNTDGYIVKGNKKGIYTPALIYLAKGTHITCPSSYTVGYYLWDNETYIGNFYSKIVEESGFYRICVRHSDATEISVDESNVLVIDEKPRIANLESNIESLNVVYADVVESVDNMVVHGKNLLDTSKCIAYGTGSVNPNTGAIDTESGTNYIYGMYNLEISQDYVISKYSSAIYVYFYNADNSYSGYGKGLVLDGSIKFKTFNAEYPKCIIVSLKDAMLQQVQLEIGTEPSFYVPFYKQFSPGIRIKDKTLCEKKVLIIGDSISTGDSSMKLYANEKYGGYNKWVDALIDEGFFNEFSTRNDSIHATGYVAKVSTFGDCDYVSRLKAIQNPNEYDYVFVTGCYNDWRHDVPLDTFKTAVNTFYDYLVNNFTQAKILVSNSLKSFMCKNANNNGNYQIEYNDYIKEVAKKYSLPFFDLYYDSGFCPEVLVYRNMWTYYAVAEGETEGVNDGVHPNERWCREFMARMIKHFIEQYI